MADVAPSLFMVESRALETCPCRQTQTVVITIMTAVSTVCGPHVQFQFEPVIHPCSVRVMFATWCLCSPDCYSDMQIREKIVDGRIAKIKEQQALLEQGFIRAEDGSTVADAIKAKIVELGENITLRRFTRYELGEGLAKKDGDFAAEVAAQTEKKDEEPAPPKQEETVCHLFWFRLASLDHHDRVPKTPKLE